MEEEKKCIYTFSRVAADSKIKKRGNANAFPLGPISIYFLLPTSAPACRLP